MIAQKDLFGNTVVEDVLLRDKFIEPPFSVLDAKNSNWVRRKKEWNKLGIKSEIGRDVKTFTGGKFKNNKGKSDRFDNKATSIFDPALCEILYHWFCVNGKEILDPFAGGSVRGIVANYLGYKYSGIDIRKEQIESNIEQAINILDTENQPKWYVGDSNVVLDKIDQKFDFLFSCPPYGNLETYSDLMGDISNMLYNEFIKAYENIIAKSCSLLNNNSYACFVVGEIRDKKGNYMGFVSDTINAFKKCGMNFYNEAIYLQQLGNASMRVENNMKAQKLVKVHQNVLIFKKND